MRVNGNDVQVKNGETGKEYRRNIVHPKKKEGEWTVCSDNQGNNTEGVHDSEAEREPGRED